MVKLLLIGVPQQDQAITKRNLRQESGASLKNAQERKGHASATTTMEIYTHVVNEEGRKFAEKVEAACPFAGNLRPNASSREFI